MPLQKRAWIYIYGTFILTVAAVVYLMLGHVQRHEPAPFTLFFTIVLTTTLLRLFVVEGPQHRSYEASTIVLFASTLILAEWQFVLVVMISFSLEWLKEHWTNSSMLRSWYIQPFNMAKTMLGGMSVYTFLHLYATAPILLVSTEGIIVALVAIFFYVFVNQALVAMWLLFVRRVAIEETGMVRDGLLIEIPLASIGYVTILLLQQSALLPIFMLAPVALIYQSFMVPKIQADAMIRMEGVNTELTAANAEIQQLNGELLLTLAKIFDARDPYVGSHAAQVAAYAVAIAYELKLPTEQIEIIRQSAYLHDIGKIAIPEAILHKPTKLTDTEYAFVKKHAEIGADFIATSHGLRHVVPFIRHHHERWDGHGYPDGLAGEAIPLEARILNVCDSIEAMASDRPYHKAMSTEEIIKEVIHCAGTQFDPEVAKAFIRIAEREGQQLVVNSARSVIQQTMYKSQEADEIKLERFAQIYGLASA